MKSESEFQRHERVSIHERRGDKTERISAVDHWASVRGLLSPRIKMDPRLRVVGNVYGGEFEALQLGSSGDGLQPYVDRSVTVGAQGIDRRIEMSRRQRWAQDAVNGLDMLRHGPLGKHRPIPIRIIVDAVCCFGRPIEEVGKSFGWVYVKERQGRPNAVSVPRRQVRKIRGGLIIGLMAINDAWEAKGYSVPTSAINVEFRGE